MPKPGDQQDCVFCHIGIMTRIREEGPDPEAVRRGEANPPTVLLRQYWKCDHCGREDESSYRMNQRRG